MTQEPACTYHYVLNVTSPQDPRSGRGVRCPPFRGGHVPVFLQHPRFPGIFSHMRVCLQKPRPQSAVLTAVGPQLDVSEPWSPQGPKTWVRALCPRRAVPASPSWPCPGPAGLPGDTEGGWAGRKRINCGRSGPAPFPGLPAPRRGAPACLSPAALAPGLGLASASAMVPASPQSTSLIPLLISTPNSTFSYSDTFQELTYS